MKIHELQFSPLRVLYNTRADAGLREKRRTIWGDLTPLQPGLERADKERIPYTYGLFIHSKDGKAVDSLKGGVGRLTGHHSDKFGQLELRTVVDAFLVGAGTLRYDRTIGAPNERGLMERRKAEKGNIAPLNCFFSASGNIPEDAAVFREPEIRTVIFVTEKAANRIDDLAKLTPDVVVVSSASPLRETWEELWRRGVRTLDFEGGPTLMGLALKERLVHELLLTHAPQLLGGTGSTFVAIDEPLHGITTEPAFIGLDEAHHLIFERSRVVYE